MNKLNALIGRIFDWRTGASRREFLKIFLVVTGAGLLIAAPYLYLAIDYIGQVINYGEDAAAMMFDDRLAEDGFFFWLFFWNVLALGYWFAAPFVSVFSIVRRLNDVKLSKWWLLLGFLPVLNLFLLCFLLLAPSKTP